MPTADVTFSVSNASSDLTFKCEVATSAGDKLAYRVQWFVEKDMEQEMLLGTSKYADLHASNINKDISPKKVHSTMYLCVSPSIHLPLSLSPSLSLPLPLFPPLTPSLSLVIACILFHYLYQITSNLKSYSSPQRETSDFVPHWLHIKSYV